MKSHVNDQSPVSSEIFQVSHLFEEETFIGLRAAKTELEKAVFRPLFEDLDAVFRAVGIPHKQMFQFWESEFHELFEAPAAEVVRIYLDMRNVAQWYQF